MLAALLLWRGRPVGAAVLGAIGGALVLAALLVPGRLGPVERWWMALAHLLSRVTTPLFLGIVYFGALTPVGWLRRRFGGNPLSHPARDGSRWFVRAPGSRRSDLRRQF